MDLTQAAKPQCLDLAGYEQRYEYVQQFGYRPSAPIGAIKAAILADLKIVELEPTISAETAANLSSFLNEKLQLVKAWETQTRRGQQHE